jgi:type III restriction/modification enzyme restriction subunit
MVITLPALEIITNHPSGNTIYHCIQPKKEFIGEIQIINRSYLVIGNDSAKCCFTGNADIAAANCSYIALSSKALKVENIIRDKFHFKRWLKHPQLHNYNPDLVLASWKDAFSFIEEDTLSGRNGLRIPQIGAIHSILGHLKLGEEIATVVLPTGTGKTETMLSVLVAAKCTKLLVVVPSDPLRNQLADKFKTLGYLKKFGIVNSNAINPIVGVLTTLQTMVALKFGE